MAFYITCPLYMESYDILRVCMICMHNMYVWYACMITCIPIKIVFTKFDKKKPKKFLKLNITTKK